MIILAASTVNTVLAAVIAFLIITLLLVAILLYVKQKLSPSGPVKIRINGEKEIEVSSGASLLTTLGNAKIFLPSACGGGGTCLQCECHVHSGGGEALPTETPHFNRKELKEGVRLACQVKVKQNMDISIPEEVFGIKKFNGTVVRNYNVASFIKEFVVEIPEDMGYKAGGYIQIEIPPCEINFSDIDITAHPEEHETPDKFKEEWDKFALWPLKMVNKEKLKGYGPNTFTINYKEYTVAAFKTWVSKNEEKSSVHNYFLLITIEQGIPGLLLLIILLFCMFAIAVKGYHVLNDPFERSLSMLCAVVLSMVVTLNLLSDLIETDKIGSIYFLLLGLLIRVQVKINQQQTNNAAL